MSDPSEVHRSTILQVGKGGRIAALWRLMTEPPDTVEDSDRRRQMRFHSALLIVLLPLSFLGSVLSHIYGPHAGHPDQDISLIVILAGCIVLSIAYALGRTEKYYRLGAAITLGAFSSGSFVLTILIPQDIENLLIYLALAILLGSLLLPLRDTTILAIASTLAVLVVPLISHEVELIAVVNMAIFVVLMSALIIVSATIHQGNIQRIEEQSSRLSDMYVAAERQAQQMQRIKNRVEAILNSVGEGLMVISLDGRIEQVNPAFESQTGYVSSEVVNRHHDSFLLAKQMPYAVGLSANAAMDAGEVWHGEMPIERKDGTVYHAAVTISPVRNHADEVMSFACSIRDISALKEVERMKDAFVSNVSHELRTPVTSIKIFLDLLSTATPEQSDGYLATLNRETDRLHHIIEAVLRLSRLDQGRVEPTIKTVDLNDLTARYAADRAPLAENHGLTIELVQESDILLAQADEGLMGQVLSILLTNAINYTPSGGKIVVCTQPGQLGTAQAIRVSVSDTGPGIPPEEQEYLFQRFFRGAAGRDSGKPGTGLGLAIAKEIVDLHGGQIELESEGVPGRGSTFHVWIPAQ
jgi:two-component system sensor histidine kinase VicK